VQYPVHASMDFEPLLCQKLKITKAENIS